MTHVLCRCFLWCLFTRGNSKVAPKQAAQGLFRRLDIHVECSSPLALITLGHGRCSSAEIWDCILFGGSWDMCSRNRSLHFFFLYFFFLSRHVKFAYVFIQPCMIIGDDETLVNKHSKPQIVLAPDAYWANKLYPGQTAPTAAVWSGHTLFAYAWAKNRHLCLCQCKKYMQFE